MGGSAFSRCAASSPLNRLSPVPSLPCTVSRLHRLSCTVSPASSLSCTVSPALSPLHRLSALSLLHLSPPFWGLFPFREFLFSSGRGVLLSAARLRGALGVCGCERKEAFSSARKRAEACRPPRRDGRTCSLRRRVANASPSHVGGHKKRADLAVRSALRFEGRPGISNPATWKPHRKFSGRWHGEAPALRRSRYPSWSSRRP